LIEGQTSDITPGRGRRLAVEGLDAKDDPGVQTDPSQVAEFHALREPGHRHGSASTCRQQQAAANPGKQGKEHQGHQHRRDARPGDGAAKSGREGVARGLGLPRLDRLRAQGVHDQCPHRRDGERYEQHGEERAVSQVRRQHHLEQRQGYQEKFRAARSRVEELEPLGEDREVGQRDHGQLASDEHCKTRSQRRAQAAIQQRA
jgi:hypothetical protein